MTNTEPYFDPLLAANTLLRVIVDEATAGPVELELARRIDAFVYALRYLLVDEVAPIPETDDEPPIFDYQQLYNSIGQRFPKIGLYWEALHSQMDSGRSGEVSAGDAIDDLADIAAALLEVEWYGAKRGRDEALAALRWRHEHHLYMHILPLRAHLEELIYVGQENDQDQPR